MRTLRRMGLQSVALYTDADRDAPHVRVADLAVRLDSPAAYLDATGLIDAAASSGADALHPGYGFLSENASLARACAGAGVTFVGPPPEAIELMGDKIRAKRAVGAAGVPVVPGTDDPGLDDDAICKAALDIGFPVLLKPSAGGGGKGMRLVGDESDLEAAVAAARREAIAAFGDGTLMVERYISKPRHVEVQVFADQFGTVVSLGERECTLQRRHQKIMEEAPSPALDDDTREAMSASAVAAAQACGYVNAGTVEFIVPGDRSGEYFFMEMNTRLQVEHPVTEMVLGVDLVEWQLRVAGGEPLPWSERPSPTGHAIEARVYAEDPDRGFLPSSGRVLKLREASGDHTRVDSGLSEGTTVTTDYDPLLAKVIAWAPDRLSALDLLRNSLAGSTILGLTTNLGFLRRLSEHVDVRTGDMDTGLVERIAPGLHRRPADGDIFAAAALLDGLLARATHTDPWLMRDGWRLSGSAPVLSAWTIAGQEVDAQVHQDGTVTVAGGNPIAMRANLDADGRLVTESGDKRVVYDWAIEGDRLWLGQAGDAWELTAVRESIDHAGPVANTSGEVTSPMPGTVLAVHVGAGDDVQEGQPLVSVEAMKMEHVVKAAVAGRVRQLLVGTGDSVKLDQPLAYLDKEDA